MSWNIIKYFQKERAPFERLIINMFTFHNMCSKCSEIVPRITIFFLIWAYLKEDQFLKIVYMNTNHQQVYSEPFDSSVRGFPLHCLAMFTS